MTRAEAHEACALAVADAEEDIRKYLITEAHHIARVFVEKARARGVYDKHYSMWSKLRKKSRFYLVMRRWTQLDALPLDGNIFEEKIGGRHAAPVVTCQKER